MPFAIQIHLIEEAQDQFDYDVVSLGIDASSSSKLLDCI